MKDRTDPSSINVRAPLDTFPSSLSILRSKHPSPSPLLPATTYASNTMPTAISNQSAQVVRYDSPTALLAQISGALYGREKECNIMLPLIEKLQTRPSFSTSPFCVTPSAPVVDDFWLVVQSNAGEVEFVVSCTNGPLGGYPIFIWCGRPVSTMSREFIHQRMTLATQHLLKSLSSPKRVFSVFGKSPLRFLPLGQVAHATAFSSNPSDPRLCLRMEHFDRF